MKVKELIELLREQPGDADVVMQVIHDEVTPVVRACPFPEPLMAAFPAVILYHGLDQEERPVPLRLKDHPEMFGLVYGTLVARDPKTWDLTRYNK